MQRYYQLCPHCKKIAFEYKQIPTKGMLMNIESIIHKDKPIAGDIIRCGECKTSIAPMYFDSRYLVTNN